MTPTTSGNERVELRHEGILRGRAGRAEEHLGVGERGLQPGHALRVAEIEATEAIFERPRVGLVRGDELAHEVGHPSAHVGHVRAPRES